MILKQRLKTILKEQDMTAAQLSRKSGLPRQTISDWLSGVAPRDIRQVKKIADVLEVSIDSLCFGTGLEENKVNDLDAIIGDSWMGGIFEVRFRRLKNSIKGE